jgi:hypothetical protein
MPPESIGMTSEQQEEFKKAGGLINPTPDDVREREAVIKTLNT